MKKYLLVIFVFIVVVIISLISYLNYNEKNEEEIISYNETTLKESTTSLNSFYVDVKGAVKKPGVYLMNDEMIVNDAIKKAGGLKENAYIKNINLSKKVKSEMVIYVYNKSEIKTTNSTTSIILNDVLYTTTVAKGGSVIEEVDKVEEIENNEKVEDKEKIEENNLININTASKEELMSLSGIGSSKADLIIAFRLNTPFSTIEDIKKVSGIGNALYEQIKNNIAV